MNNISDWIEPEAVTFDCPGCGRRVIAICSYKMSHRVCGACCTHPGWYNTPELRRALDPFDDRDESRINLTSVEVECRAAWLHALLSYLQRGVRIIEDQVEPFAVEQEWHDRPTIH